VAVGTTSRRQPAHRGWRRSGESLVREVSFRDFDGALGFAEQVAIAAEDYLRRPDILIYGFNRVRLTIANPNHAGLTLAEHRLAAKVSRLIDGPSAA
jgi:4a-hydroxytetrahydrobiopterin dehydratase